MCTFESADDHSKLKMNVDWPVEFCAPRVVRCPVGRPIGIRRCTIRISTTHFSDFDVSRRKLISCLTRNKSRTGWQGAGGAVSSLRSLSVSLERARRKGRGARWWTGQSADDRDMIGRKTYNKEREISRMFWEIMSIIEREKMDKEGIMEEGGKEESGAQEGLGELVG